MSADTVANALLTSLLNGTMFNIPTLDLTGAEFQFPDDGTGPLYTQVSRVDVADITDGTVGGSGAFDKIATSLKAHLREEFDAGRITGDQYTKAYISMMESALSNATNFVLARESNFWDAINAQMTAITGRYGLEIRKFELSKSQIETELQKIAYATGKLSLATAEVNYDTAAYNLSDMLPQQLANLGKEEDMLDVQIVNAGKDGLLIDSRTTLTDKQALQVVRQTTHVDKEEAVMDAQILLTGKQGDMITAQISHEAAKELQTIESTTLLSKEILLRVEQTLQATAQTDLIGTQEDKVDQEILNLAEALKVTTEQIALTREQMESQRSQTLDTRSDGTTIITGSVGKQKDLYSQQITSYQRDSEIKAAKIFSDAWITQKTIDEGLTAPTVFTNATIDDVLSAVQVNNGLD